MIHHASTGPLHLRLTAERKFFACTAIAMLVVTYAGFAPSYFLAPFTGARPVTPIVHLHAAVFSAWILLYTAQNALVSAGRVDLHRKLGIVGAFLVPAVVVLGYCTVILTTSPAGVVAARVGRVPIMFPLAAVSGFGLLAAIGLWRRRDAATHKRLMFLATTSLIVTPFARLARMAGSPLPPPVNGMLLSDIFVIGLIAFDLRQRGRLHPVTLWAGGALLLSQPLRVLLNQTAAWQSFAAALLA